MPVRRRTPLFSVMPRGIVSSLRSAAREAFSLREFTRVHEMREQARSGLKRKLAPLKKVNR
jgi:hypothetical protein